MAMPVSSRGRRAAKTRSVSALSATRTLRVGTSMVAGPSPIAMSVAATRSSEDVSRTWTSTTLRPASRLSSRGVPEAMTRPWSMMAICDAR